ncbi:MAG: hypothetical protein SGILL_004133, partial [Bacillariaceae sp.]
LREKELDSKLEIFDVVVAGAGAAGLSAALFAARAGLHVLVLGSSQGLLSQTKRLDNFPSFVGDTTNDGSNSAPASGESWLQVTKRQAGDFGATFAPPGLLATSIERSRLASSEEDDVTDSKTDTNIHDGDVFFSLKTPLDEYHALSVIVASGATPRTLDLPHESDLWGVSLHNCAICDGHLYSGKDKHVLVVGGGDAALDAAVMLARYAGRVTLVHRRNDFSSANNPANLQVVESTSNIEVLTPFVVEKWKIDPENTMQLVGATLKDQKSGAVKEFFIDGAFVMIGATPNTEWMKTIGIGMDNEGLIQLPHQGSVPNAKGGASFTTQASVPGIFAAGEVTDRIYKQAITAAASGAEAAIDAERWLRESHGVHFHEPSAAKIPAMVVHSPANNHVDVKMLRRHKNTVGKATVESDSSDSQDKPVKRRDEEALSIAGVKEPYVIDLSLYPTTKAIQSTLQELTGRRTVPNVFVGAKSIGGGDETAALLKRNGLVPVLEKAGALDSKREQVDQKQVAPPADWKKVSESCDLLLEDCFKEVVARYPVVMFSLAWCPECRQSLELLKRIGVQPHIIDLDDYKVISKDIRLHMLNITGRRSVPNLFIGGEYIGGFRRTSKMHEKGELIPKLQKAGVL